MNTRCLAFLGLGSLVAAGWASGCQPSDSTDGTGTGGHVSATGGAPSGTGGSSQGATGGASTGGASSTGGSTNTGGATSTGGTSTGGASSSGGGSTATGGGLGGAGPKGGSAGGAPSGTGGGAGGTTAGGWVNIMPVDASLKDAQGVSWFPYVKGYTPGMDPLKTYRYDATTGYLVVTYADYPNGSFDNHLGLLYYDKKLTNYKVRVEYHFKDPQAKNPVSWGKNNSGLFVFCTDPHMITGNPDFPTGIEIQLLGYQSAGGDINCQICLNSTVAAYPAKVGNTSATTGCVKSTQNPSDFKTQNAAATWVTVEADVSSTGTTNIYQYTPDGMKPASTIQTFTAPVKTGGQTLTSGWISLQAESQPLEFRKIELMEMP